MSENKSTEVDPHPQIEERQLTQLYLGGSIVGWRTSQCENPEDAVLNRTLLRFLSDESGATAIEYGLIQPVSRWRLLRWSTVSGPTSIHNLARSNNSLK